MYLLILSLACVEIAKENYRKCMKEVLEITNPIIFEHKMKECSKKYRQEKYKCDQ